MEIAILKGLNAETTKKLIKIWQESVEESHNFLNKDNIKEIKEKMPNIFEKMEHILTINKIDSKNNIIAFMGLLKDKIEMLFVSPKFFKQGLGSKLVTHAIKEYKIKFVDVNEQNTAAVHFYHNLGFKTFKISDTDNDGYPFPILHLKFE